MGRPYMLIMSRRRILRIFALGGISSAVLAACNDDKQTVASLAKDVKTDNITEQKAMVEGASESRANLAGTVLIDGSSTVGPLSQIHI